MSTTLRRACAAAAATAVVALVGAVSGCGSNSASVADDPVTTHSSGPSHPVTSHTPAAPEHPEWPACAQIWQTGAKLAVGYQGCNQGGSSVEADRIGCSSGQRIVRYDNRFWAVMGGTISHAANLLHDHEFIHDVRVCRG